MEFYLKKFFQFKIALSKLKNKSIYSSIIKDKTELKRNYNKITENRINKRKNNINNNNKKILKNYLILTLIQFITMNISNCSKLFDLINFQDSKITLKIKGIGYNDILHNGTEYCFKSFNNIIQININGKQQDIISYRYYFNQTDNVVELIFDDRLTNCQYMFYSCCNITEIDLSNFNTSKITSMGAMFLGCSSLISLDLSRFDTSKVRDMFWMFHNCSSLTSLNLSNFNTSQVTNLDSMFRGCANLEYINLNNFVEISLRPEINYYQKMFLNVPDNVVICIKENNTNSKIFSQISLKKCNVIDCTNDWKLKQKKIINNNNECIESCDKSTQYQYEYNGKCYDNCSQGFLYDKNNNKMNRCKCKLDECLICTNVSFYKGLCTECNKDYYQKENDSLNIGEYIKCYKEPEGYYLDINIYKKCYYTCKTCNISGDDNFHNCIKCNDNFKIGIKNNNYLNCYEACSNYYYLDDENNYHCTINSSCPKEYPRLNTNKMECNKNFIENIIEDLLINGEDELENLSKEEEIEYYDNLILNIEKGLKENYDTSKLDNGHDEVIKSGKVTWTLTTLQNQMNNINRNITLILLGECENILRNYYNITNNETIYMKKIEVAQEGFKIPKIEYDVYSLLSGENLIKLNLSICENTKIVISIPIKLNESLDKLNSSSRYYNDICYTTTSEDGTDITLNDRKQDFVDKNKTVCQEDCVFSKYNNEKMKVECSCSIKKSSISISDMNIKKAKLFQNFKDIKNIVNLNFLVCYKKLFRKDAIINNIGCYIIFSIILFHIISICVLYAHDLNLIKKKIKEIINRINEDKILRKNEKHEKNQSKNDSNGISIYKKNKKKKRSKRSKRSNKIKKIDDNSKKTIIIQNDKLKQNKNEKIIYLINYIEEEINELPFNLAIQYDKRVFCQYYISLIKTKHSLIFAFCDNNDYNSKIIKIDLFFIGFTIDYIVNALFFNDDTMHKIYKRKGEFDFEAQLPIIVYSTFISMILNAPLNFLSLSNDAIIKFKQEHSKFDIMKRAKYLEKKLNAKFILYFIISFLFLCFFWYYISMFCVIYRNTKIHLLKDTLMSFGLSLLFPFFLYLFPGFFRIYSLSDSHNKKECLYNFSKFLQSF